MAFLLLVGVSAEEDTTAEELPDAGTTPDSPFWGIDVAFDNMRHQFATNAQERARIRLEIANERLAEM